jgi:hypothetical protein
MINHAELANSSVSNDTALKSCWQNTVSILNSAFVNSCAYSTNGWLDRRFEGFIVPRYARAGDK